MIVTLFLSNFNFNFKTLSSLAHSYLIPFNKRNYDSKCIAVINMLVKWPGIIIVNLQFLPGQEAAYYSGAYSNARRNARVVIVTIASIRFMAAELFPFPCENLTIRCSRSSLPLCNCIEIIGLFTSLLISFAFKHHFSFSRYIAAIFPSDARIHNSLLVLVTNSAKRQTCAFPTRELTNWFHLHAYLLISQFKRRFINTCLLIRRSSSQMHFAKFS